MLNEMDEKKCNDIFKGEVKSHVKCNTCKSTSTSTDEIADLSLSIPSSGEVNLEDLLKKHFRPQVLSKDNCYDCVKCQRKKESTKRLSITTTPT